MKYWERMMYSIGDLVLLQGWRVGLVVAVSDIGFTDWVQVKFPVAGIAWLDGHRLKPL